MTDGGDVTGMSGDDVRPERRRNLANNRDLMRADTYRELNALADFSNWAPFQEAYPSAPLTPGVYMFREARTQTIVYVGHAGERAGRQDGIRGRLAVYRSGKGSTSGFGMAAFDRALADETWLRSQLEDLRAGQPKRALVWAQEAIARVQPEISWATTADKPTAIALESRLEEMLRPHGLWNRPRTSLARGKHLN